jgi:TRAP-type C4-dicarboxylate transport system substrate-binding protein
MQIDPNLARTIDERVERKTGGKIELSIDTLQQLMAEEAAIIAIRSSVRKAARNARRAN